MCDAVMADSFPLSAGAVADGQLSGGLQTLDHQNRDGYIDAGAFDRRSRDVRGCGGLGSEKHLAGRRKVNRLG